jgi:hypothetical protein
MLSGLHHASNGSDQKTCIIQMYSSGKIVLLSVSPTCSENFSPMKIKCSRCKPVCLQQYKLIQVIEKNSGIVLAHPKNKA